MRKERLLFYFFLGGKNSIQDQSGLGGKWYPCGGWLQACVYLDKDAQTPWTMGSLTGVGNQYIPNTAQEKNSGCERVSVSSIDFLGAAGEGGHP